MERKYRHLTVWVGWQPSENSVEDQGRNDEHGFDEFARFVIHALQHRAAVDARTIYSAGRSIRQVKFSASTPLTVEDWSDAIRPAVKACCVITSQGMWSFE